MWPKSDEDKSTLAPDPTVAFFVYMTMMAKISTFYTLTIQWIHGDFFRRSIVLASAWNPWEAITRWWRRRGGGREMRGRGNLGNCWDEKWQNTKQWTQRSRILLSGTPYIWQESTKNEKLLQSGIFSVRYCQTVLYQGPWQWIHWNTYNEGQAYYLIKLVEQ